MPQIFQVLRCYECFVFQVHQTKKLNNWECKMCGVKQSIKRHYGIGTGQECRHHVQKLNGLRGDIEDLKQSVTESGDEENEEPINKIVIETPIVKESKWHNYLETLEPLDDNSPMFMDNTEVVLELHQKSNRKLSNQFKNKVMKSLVKNDSFKNKKVKKSTNDDNYDDLQEDHRTETSSLSATKFNVPMSDVVESTCTDTIQTVTKKFKVPKINRSSKWAEYADQPEDLEEKVNEDIYENESSSIPSVYTQATPGPTQPQYKSNTLFSLCDDDDYDNILDL